VLACLSLMSRLLGMACEYTEYASEVRADTHRAEPSNFSGSEASI